MWVKCVILGGNRNKIILLHIKQEYIPYKVFIKQQQKPLEEHTDL